MWLATAAAGVFLARAVVVAVGWWYRDGVLASAVVFAIAVAVHVQATA